MAYQLLTVPVVRFIICDDDEGMHEPDNPVSFESADEMLRNLREQNPEVNYTMIAEIDA